MAENVQPRWVTAALCAALVWFAAASTVHLGTPGLHYDEGDVGAMVTLYLDEMGQQGPASWLPPAVDDIEGSTIPALLALSMGLFGVSFWTLRLPFVLLGIATILILFNVLRRWFGWRPALVTVALLCMDVTYIQAVRVALCRQGVIHIFFFWTLVLLAQRYADHGRRTTAVLFGLVLGLALNAKIMIIGFVLAGAAAALLAWPGRIGKQRSSWPNRPALAALCGGFVVASAHFWWEHLTRGIDSFSWIWRNFEGDGPWDNGEMLGNLAIRLQDVGLLLTGRLFDFGEPGGPGPMLLPLPLVVTAVALPCLAWHATRDGEARPLRFVLLTHLVLFGLTVFVPGRHSPGHLVVLSTLYPFCAAMALELLLAPRTGADRRRRRLLNGAAAALTAALVLSTMFQGRETAKLLSRLADGRGSKTHAPRVLREVVDRFRRISRADVYNLTDFGLFELEFFTAQKTAVNRKASDWLGKISASKSGPPREAVVQSGRWIVREMVGDTFVNNAAAYLLVQTNSPVWQAVWQAVANSLKRQGHHVQTVDNHRQGDLTLRLIHATPRKGSNHKTH